MKLRHGGLRGGSMNNQAIGGLGAHMKGEFMLEQGQNIFVLVGQQGIEAGYGSGGGGGTFVTAGASVNGEILIIAGGGGGSNNYSDNVSGGPGLASTAAGNSNVNIGNSECSCGGDGMGGVNGNGGGHGCAGGGGGYYSSGLNGDHQASGGASFILGGTGGGKHKQSATSWGIWRWRSRITKQWIWRRWRRLFRRRRR